MLKWGCLGALIGCLAGCTFGVIVAFPEMRRGMQDPGWIIGPMLMAGTVGGLVLGLVSRFVAWLYERFRSRR